MDLIPIWVYLLMGLQLVTTQDFSYQGSSGPDHWADEYSTCNGKLQSPINVNSDQIRQKFFRKLIVDRLLERPVHALIQNNGHTAVINYKYRNEPPRTQGGPLNNDIYRLVQMHLHWGQNSLEGSEDRINNKSYPAELHVVWSNVIYPSFDEAIKHNNGIAVFAFFIELDFINMDNPSYKLITDSLEKIHFPNSTIRILDPVPLFALLPLESGYFTYNGSLTTPPCSENVIWIDFQNKISMSERQIDSFRHLIGPDGQPLSRNFRPTQPLNDRPVYFHAYDLHDLATPLFVESGSSSLHRYPIKMIIIIGLSIIFALVRGTVKKAF